MPLGNVALGDVEKALPERELVSFMDFLAARGVEEAPRAGFWRDLERAAEALCQAERASTYHVRFLATLANEPGERERSA